MYPVQLPLSPFLCVPDGQGWNALLVRRGGTRVVACVGSPIVARAHMKACQFFVMMTGSAHWQRLQCALLPAPLLILPQLISFCPPQVDPPPYRKEGRPMIAALVSLHRTCKARTGGSRGTSGPAYISQGDRTGELDGQSAGGSIERAPFARTGIRPPQHGLVAVV